MAQCNEHSQIKMCGQKGILCTHCDTLQLPKQERYFCFVFFCGGDCKSGEWVCRDGEMSGIEVHDVKLTKNQQKVKQNKK